MPRFLPFKWVARVLSVLLLITAGLKLHGLAADPIATHGVFAAPETQLAVIEAEVLLSLWLWLAWETSPLGPWLAATSIFGAFACASFYMGWIGQTSCGCAGAFVSVSPWYALALDVFILAALVLGRPSLGVGAALAPSFPRPGRPAACGLGAVVIISGLMGVFASLSFGSLPAALAYLRGERVSITPALVDLGSAKSGETRQLRVEVTNRTGESIRLIGGTKDCSCTVLDDLPLDIRPGESRPVLVTVRFTGAPGVFTRQADLLLDDLGFRIVHFRLTGRIIGLPPSELP